jgi:hypothetical protein
MSPVNPLARLRTVEFFGTLVPGLFMVAAVCFGYMVADAKDLAEVYKRLLDHFNSSFGWYPIAIVLFSAYMLGSVLRAFPVWKLDNLLGVAFGRLVSKSASEAKTLLYREKREPPVDGKKTYKNSSFPYPALLTYDRKQLADAGCISQDSKNPFENARGASAHIAFDYCKEYVSRKSTTAAARIQEFEARTRMLYGMVWASVLGSIGAIIISIAHTNWFPLVWLFLSIPIVIVFGQRLRFVRGVEARMAFYAYLIQQEIEKQPQTPDSSSTTPPTSEQLPVDSQDIE